MFVPLRALAPNRLNTFPKSGLFYGILTAPEHGPDLVGVSLTFPYYGNLPTRNGEEERAQRFSLNTALARKKYVGD